MCNAKKIYFASVLSLVSIGSIMSAEAGEPLSGIGDRCCPFSDEHLKQDIQPLQGGYRENSRVTWSVL